MEQPRYGKSGTAWKGILIGIGVICVVLIAVIAVLLSGLNIWPADGQAGGKPTGTTTTTGTTTGTTTTTIPAIGDREPGQYSKPEEMKAVWLKAGTDYLKKSTDTVATVKKQIDTALAKVVEWKFNTVILPVQSGEKTLYPSEYAKQLSAKDDPSFDPIAYVIDQAKLKNIYVYLVFDFGVTVEEGNDPTDAATVSTLTKAVEELARRYAKQDGVMLTGYGYPLNTKGDAEMMKKATAGMMEAALRALRKQNNNWYIGLLSSSVWAHKHIDSRGSDTNMIYEDLTDGFADTYTWLADNWFDFVMVQTATSTSHSTAAFTSILDWWNARCAEWNVALYVSHAVDLVGSTARGWNTPDQLAKQLLCCQESAMWRGSAYHTYSALSGDKTGSTKALMSAYAGTLDTKFIYTELKITNPKKTSYTTDESTVAFQGSADRNFDLTINGTKVALSEKGFFSVEYTLKQGKNTFKFVHKGKTVTYTVTYDPVIIKSVTPNKALTVPGDSELIVSAIAREGTTLYAKLNGTQIKMEPSGEQVDDDLDDADSDYCKYTGTYTVGAGKVNKSQSLGTVTFYATYKGMSDTATGGKVTIAAIKVENPDEEIQFPSDTDLEYISPNTGGTTLKSGKIYMISTDYAETFSGTTTDDYSRPINAYLPYGTTDVYVKTVTDSSTGSTYYLLGSGQRVYTDAVKLAESNGKLSANAFSNVSTSVSAKYTTIKLDASWRVPFNLQILPQKYTAGSNKQPQYALHNQKLTGEYVDITFFYTTTEPETPDVSKSTVFKSAEWRKGSDNSYILRLYLRNKGYFYGYAVAWDDEGSITFAFRQAIDLTANPEDQPLKGVTIMLDPGHGGKTGQKPSGTWTLDPNLYEKTMNLQYSMLLKEKLEAKGATVLMTRTTDVSLSMEARIAMMREKKPDLLLSVHMNGVKSSTPSGASVHYFNEYSYRVSDILYDRIDALEEKHGLGNRATPVTWGTLYMTRIATECPTVLLECGFVTTQKDFDKLVSTAYREEFTTAVANGIQDYFQSLP